MPLASVGDAAIAGHVGRTPLNGWSRGMIGTDE